MQSYSKAIKDDIARQIMECQAEITIPYYSQEAIQQLWYSLEREYALLFHLNKTLRYVYNQTTMEAVLKPGYLYSGKEYETLSARIQAKLSQLKEKFCKVPSQLERELQIHDWFCRNVRYKETGPDSHSIVGPLLQGESVCEGIAEAAQLLLTTCGIPALVITGKSSDNQGQMENHAWNVVQIQGKWYHLDITHDLTLASDHIRYDYFNVSSGEIMKYRTLHPKETFPLSRCHDEQDYYTGFHCYYPTTEAFRAYLKQCIARREPHLQMRLGPQMTQATVPDLFKQCMQEANIGASYQYSVNDKRNVWEWTIQYKEDTASAPKPPAPKPPAPTPKPPVPQPPAPTPKPPVPQPPAPTPKPPMPQPPAPTPKPPMPQPPAPTPKPPVPKSPGSPYSAELKAQVARQLKDLRPEIQVPFYSEADLRRLQQELEREDPFLFHLGTALGYTLSPSGKTALLRPRYLYSGQAYAQLANQIQAKVQGIRDQALQAKTELGRELYLHGLLARDITLGDDGFESKTVIGPLLRGRGSCEGIAKTVKLLFEACGISAQILSGTPHSGKGPVSQVWNVVRINGNGYHLDVAADCLLTGKHIRYDYFNLSTREILQDRSIDPGESFSPCTHQRDYYDLFGRSFASLDALGGYLKQCFLSRDPHIQVRMGQGLSPEAVEAMFRRVLEGLNLRASCQCSTNPTRGIFQWIIRYQQIPVDKSSIL